MDKILTIGVIIMALVIGVYIGGKNKTVHPPAEALVPTPAAAPPAAQPPIAPTPQVPPPQARSTQLKPTHHPTQPKPPIQPAGANTNAPPDPFAQRKLDLPLPKSMKDLADNSKEFKDAEMPGRPGQYDGSLLTTYHGFYEAAPGKFRQISFNNTISSRILLFEQVKGDFKEFRSEFQDFDVQNFNGDVYSFVFRLRNGKVLYLKFYESVDVPDYTDNYRAMKGWLIEEGVARKVAMIDGMMKELEDLKLKGKFVWPALGSIRRLLPGDLP